MGELSCNGGRSLGMAHLAACALLVLVGCELPEGEYFGRIPEPNPTHLRWCLGDPQSLDPARYELAMEVDVFSNLFDPLVVPDERFLPRPGLAESWTVSHGYRVYTFSLRKNARFSNGRPLVAADVRFTVLRFLHPLFASNMAQRLFPIRNAEAYNAGRAKVVLRDTHPFGAREVVELLEDKAPNPDLRVARTALGLRPEPAASSEPYATLPEGAQVTIVELGPSERWAYVHHAAGEGVFGWTERDQLHHPNADRVYPVRSLDRAVEQPRNGTVRGRDLLGLPQVLGVRVIDDHTIAFELEQPTPYFLLRAMAIQPAAREVVSRWPRSWFRPEHIVTSGPFHLAAWEPRHRLELVRSNTYRDRERVRLERITIVVSDNAAARANLYYAGECDLARGPPNSYAPLLLGGRSAQRTPRKDVREAEWGGKVYVELNNKKLTSAHFRRALARSVDRRELRELLPGNMIPSRQFSLCQATSMLSDADLERCGVAREAGAEICLLDEDHCYAPPPFPGFDLEQARQDLAASRQELGGRFPSSLTVRYAIQHPINRRVAEWLQSVWGRALGLGVDVQGQDLNTLVVDVVGGVGPDAVVWGLESTYHPEDWILPAMQCGNYFNGAQFCDAEYERLLASAREQGRLEHRIRQLGRAEQRLADQVPLIPLYSFRGLWLEKPYVRDQIVAGLLHNVWIDPSWKGHGE